MSLGGASRLRAALLGLVVFALMLAACSGGDDSARAQVKRPATTAPRTTTTVRPTTTTVPDYITYSATVKPTVTSIGVFTSPGDPQPSRQFANPWLYDPGNPATGVPQTFLVKSQRPDGWIEVLLPVRPNGSTGWVQANDVTLAANPYHIAVSLGSYGPFAYGLSSHSDALESFAGGDAEIGIHGNDDASALGSSVSHGCIRMDNAAISVLATKLPFGTPVDITA